MHGDDRLGPRRDRRLGLVRVDAPGFLEDVDEHRLGAKMNDRRRSRDPVGVGHDHLVARPDSERRHAHVQRARAARRRDGVSGAQVGFERVLEAADVFVATLAPAVLRGVGGVRNLEFGDRRSCISDAVAHRICSLEIAVTNAPPHALA